jgi:hypothetical protein
MRACESKGNSFASTKDGSGEQLYVSKYDGGR